MYFMNQLIFKYSLSFYHVVPTTNLKTSFIYFMCWLSGQNYVRVLDISFSVAKRSRNFFIFSLTGFIN